MATIERGSLSHMSTQVLDDGDIGKCDDCGEEVDPGVRTIRTVTIKGTPTNLAVYLCQECASG